MQQNSSNKQIVRKLLTIDQVTEEMQKEMFALFEKYYDHVDYSRFVEHLKEKTHIFIFSDKSQNEIIGFSTIFRKSLPHVGPGIFLFSGDTVIHQDYWGNKMLHKSFFQFLVESKLRSPFTPIYWMLMSKGVKTYMIMRKTVYESYPNYKRATPPHIQEMLTKFYKSKFPGDFKQDKGLILFKEKIGSVKSDLASPVETIIRSEDADFFLKVNPHFLEGDELACIAEIRFRDFLSYILRFFIKQRS